MCLLLKCELNAWAEGAKKSDSVTTYSTSRKSGSASFGDGIREQTEAKNPILAPKLTIGRIVTGREATAGRFPYLVMCRRSNQAIHYGSRTIIGMRPVLLTAILHLAPNTALVPNHCSVGTLLSVSKITEYPKFESLLCETTYCTHFRDRQRVGWATLVLQ